jgi:DNA-binding transcriptional LysR family regulator
MNLDLRDLRYFVAVAEELHFSRAAERLHLDQPTLSRHVRRLEEKLGVRLLDRTTRHVALTDAGRAFVHKARAALAAADAAVDVAHAAADGRVGVLRVGMMVAGWPELRTKACDAFEERYPGVELRTLSYPFAEPTCGLASGETDVAFVTLPLPHPLIATERLYDEPRVFVLAPSHRLASKVSISLKDVEDEPFFALSGREDDPTATAWDAFWQLQPRPDGTPRPVGAVVATEEEWFDAIIRGRAISTTALSAATLYPLPGVTYVPAKDLDPVILAIGWRTDRLNRVVLNFVELVQELRDAAVPDVHARRP